MKSWLFNNSIIGSNLWIGIYDLHSELTCKIKKKVSFYSTIQRICYLIAFLLILKSMNNMIFITSYNINQGLLELLWTVYSERKLQSCLKLRDFQNF